MAIFSLRKANFSIFLTNLCFVFVFVLFYFFSGTFKSEKEGTRGRIRERFTSKGPFALPRPTRWPGNRALSRYKQPVPRGMWPYEQGTVPTGIGLLRCFKPFFFLLLVNFPGVKYIVKLNKIIFFYLSLNFRVCTQNPRPYHFNWLQKVLTFESLYEVFR